MSGNLIQSDPSVMMGKPIITGTRITVELYSLRLGTFISDTSGDLVARVGVAVAKPTAF
jgi:uncharacterized protein (DUF433 family)